MNTKRLIVASIVVFVFVYLYDWVFHGFILKNAYVQTASLWRPEQEMMSYFHFLVLGQAVTAFMASLVFAKTCKSGSICEGLNYGALLGLLFAGPSLITYAVQPLPATLVGLWVIGAIVKFVIAGLLLGGIGALACTGGYGAARRSGAR